MTTPIKPGLDRRVAKRLDDCWMAFANRPGPHYPREWISSYACDTAIRAIASELPPTQAARLLKAAGIEIKGKR